MYRSRGLVLTLAVAATLTIGGCGEVAYKTGAGADALKADELACKQSSAGTYDQCMSAKGWSIASLDGSGTQTAPGAPESMPVAAPAAIASGTAPSSAPAAMVTPPPPDPSAPVHINGWAKFGGGGPNDDIAACVDSLGPSNQPDTAHKTVTRALLSCMHEKGWRGL